MRKNISTLAIVFLGLMVGLFTVSCEKNQQVADRDLNAGALAVLHIPTDAQGRIVPNASGNVLNLSASNTYLLDSVTRVPAGYTLNIPAGTTIQTGTARTYTVVNPLDPSDVETRSIAGVLVVEKGGKLNANGTATAPVVFTAASSSPQAGDFGGIIILGNAKTNKLGTQEIEGLPAAPTPGGNTYGSDATKNTESSGSLTYVRIEYPGLRLFENQEINGLTLGGVGSGTTLSHIQVLWSADDGFEFFGGTVNADYLVANSNDDDDFDFDFGYSGTISHSIALKDPSSTHSISGGSSDANGIESDNDGSGSGATPVTTAKLDHVTILGYPSSSTDLRNGGRIRRASDIRITNSIIAGFPGGLSLESAASSASFNYSILHAFTALYPGSPFTPSPTGVNTSTASTGVGTVLGLGANPFYTGTFNPAHLTPIAAPANTGSSTSGYRGAVPTGAANNWVVNGINDGWLFL